MPTEHATRNHRGLPDPNHAQIACSHCGRTFAPDGEGLVPTHDYPRPCRMVCPGSRKRPPEPAIPDGNYFGKWAGHSVRVDHAGQEFDFDVEQGIRTPVRVDCILTVRGGRAVKVEVVDVNRNKLPS